MAFPDGTNSQSDFETAETREILISDPASPFLEVYDYCFERKDLDAVMALWPKMCVVFDANLSSRSLQRIRSRMEDAFAKLEVLRNGDNPDNREVSRTLGRIIDCSNKVLQLTDKEAITTAFLLYQFDSHYGQIDIGSQIGTSAGDQVQDIIITRYEGVLTEKDKEAEFIRSVNKTIGTLFFTKLEGEKTSSLLTQYHIAVAKLQETESMEVKKAAMKMMITALIKMFILFFYEQTSIKHIHIINAIFAPLSNIYNNPHLLDLCENADEIRGLIEELFDMFLENTVKDEEALEAIREKMYGLV